MDLVSYDIHSLTYNLYFLKRLNTSFIHKTADDKKRFSLIILCPHLYPCNARARR